MLRRCCCQNIWETGPGLMLAQQNSLGRECTGPDGCYTAGDNMSSYQKESFQNLVLTPALTPHLPPSSPVHEQEP